jgi:hypothetical protein
VKPYDHSTVVMTCPGCGAEVDVDLRITLMGDPAGPGSEMLSLNTRVVHNHGTGIEYSQLWLVKEE